MLIFFVSLQGEKYKMTVEVPEIAKLSALRVALLFTRDSLRPKGFGGLTNVGGRRGKSLFYTNITIPNDVRFKIIFI